MAEGLEEAGALNVLAWLGVASGITLAATGLALLAARPRRAGSRFFALFTIVWGADILLFNSLGLVPDQGLQQAALGIGLALALVESLFLVHFVVRFADAQDTRHGWWTYGVGAYVLIIGGALAIAPQAFLEGAGFTPLASVLVFVPNFAAFYISLYVLIDMYRSMERETVRVETAIVGTALALYASYTAGFFATFYSLKWLSLDTLDGATEAPFLALFVAAVGLLIVQARQVLASMSGPGTRQADGWILAALVVPLVLGIATGLPSRLTDARIDLFGFLRIVAALFIAYGLVKFEIFDLDLKIKRAVKRGLVLSAFVITFFLTSEAVELYVSGTVGPWAGLGAAGLLTLGFRPIEQRASQLADRTMPGVQPSQDYLEQRASEIYQAAVERAGADEVLSDREKQVLIGLREDLNLGEKEARTIEQRILSEPVGI